MRDLSDIRADLPALARLGYLNTGTAGPMPAVAADAMRRAIAEDAERGRISGKRFVKIDEMMERCRVGMAGIVGAQPEQIALTSGTVDGLSIVLDRLTLPPGARLLTSDMEHPAALGLLRSFAARRGLVVEGLALEGTDDAEAAARVAAALKTPAALLMLSHVGYANGRVLPLPQIAAAARAANVPLLVDGAQAAGAIALDLVALGVDFYAWPGQKWLMGPEGAGALYIAPDALSLLGGASSPPETAKDVQRGTLPKPVWAGMEAALDWRAAQGSEAELTAATAEAAEAMRSALAQVPGVELAEAPRMAGLVCFAMAGQEAGAVLMALGKTRLAGRDVPGPAPVRLSCGFFTSPDEIAATAGTLATLTTDAVA
ncbi:aminotransferase class V-fold PLP-dependent enzyme [Salipiger sp. P9]|uniref:aminotransferase class V-fold PLP-dependent enzyme n=1 Tax=Salipiger pentaromativorans TaxID=2943193 RepID=UPI002157C47B|nr:aminotransferase class V-fold PLP-dependent enzyme [Salipiger pentaromativorans]MCR8549179.1 aminotransferase class V-fold PLP-dependent enzyme [Salipiger pentaromativorans]